MAAEGFGGRPTTSRGRRHRMQWARRRLRLWDALTRIAAGAGLELGAHAARRGGRRRALILPPRRDLRLGTTMVEYQSQAMIGSGRQRGRAHHTVSNSTWVRKACTASAINTTRSARGPIVVAAAQSQRNEWQPDALGLGLGEGEQRGDDHDAASATASGRRGAARSASRRSAAAPGTTAQATGRARDPEPVRPHLRPTSRGRRRRSRAACRWGRSRRRAASQALSARNGIALQHGEPRATRPPSRCHATRAANAPAASSAHEQNAASAETRAGGPRAATSAGPAAPPTLCPARRTPHRPTSRRTAAVRGRQRPGGPPCAPSARLPERASQRRRSAARTPPRRRCRAPRGAPGSSAPARRRRAAGPGGGRRR